MNHLVILTLVLFFSNLLARPNSITNLSALTGTILGEVKLSWTYPGPDTLPKGSSYYIQHSSYSVEWSPENAQIRISTGPVSPGEVQFYSITTLIPNRIYFFRIWTSSSGIFSEISNAATAHSQGPPGRINDLSATPKFRTAILTWTAPGADGDYYDLFNATFTIRYSSTTQVWGSMENQINIPTSTPRGSLQTYKITGLLNRTTYWFIIRTRDALGYESELSNLTTNYSTNIPPPAFDLVDPDKYIALTPIVTFYWQYLSDPDEPYGDYISSYTLRISTVSNLSVLTTIYYGIKPSTFVYKNIIVSSWTINISPPFWIENTTYYWSIIVYDSESSTNTTFEVPHWFAKNLTQEPPRAPTLQRPIGILHGPGAREPLFDFTDSTDPDPGDYVSHYKIEVSTRPPPHFISSFTFTTSVSSYQPVNDTFAENTTYYWRVTAYDSTNRSSTTVTRKFITNEINSKPLPFSLNLPDNNVILGVDPWLQWSKSVEIDPGDFLVGYVIRFSSSVSDEKYLRLQSDDTAIETRISKKIISPSLQSCYLLGLQENATYWWCVLAVDSAPAAGYNPPLTNLTSTNSFTATEVRNFRIDKHNEPPEPFTLYTPSGNISALSPIFDWQCTRDPDPTDELAITTYTIKISTIAPHGPIWREKTNITTSYFRFDENFDNFTTYYWWVVAEAGTPPAHPVLTTTSSISWSFFIGNHAPSPPILYQPQHLQILPTATTTFLWQESTDPNNDPIRYELIYYTVGFSTTIILTTTYYTPTQLIENSSYTWYVIARDTWGLSNISTVRNFYVNSIEEFPTNPTPIEPPNNSVLNFSAPTFTWKVSTDPDPTDSVFYTLHIHEYYPWDSNILKSSTTLTLTTTSYTITPLKENHKYTWFVIAQDTSSYKKSSSGTVSETFVFYINTTPEPPLTPLLFYPTGQLVVIGISSPTFKWSESKPVDPLDSVEYKLRYTDHLGISTSVIITTTFYTPAPLLENARYTWHVTAISKNNKMNSKSDDGVFYMDFIPESPYKPLLLKPENNSVINTLTPTFEWSRNIPVPKDYEGEEQTFPDPDYSGRPSGKPLNENYHAVYRLYYTTDTKIKPNEVFLPNVTKHTLDRNLQENTTYYWWIEIIDNTNLCAVSSTFTFMVNAIEEFPTNPTPIEPLNNLVLNYSTPTFTWRHSFDPDPTDSVFYIFHINEYYPWDSNILISSTTLTLTTTSYTTLPLKENHKYTWFIIAKDTSTYKTSSTGTITEVYTVYISTYEELPGDFSLISPKGRTTKLQPTFKWTRSDPVDPLDEVIYELYCYYEVGGTLRIRDLNIVTTEYTPGTVLTEGGKYNWYIIARDKQNNKKTSQTFQIFIDTIEDPPRKFELLHPSGTVRTITPNLLWQETSDPDEGDFPIYELRIATDPEFKFYISTITQITSYTPTLSHNATYYWYVIAKDLTGLATTTQVWTFYIPPMRFLPPPEKITLNVSPHPDPRYNQLKIEWERIEEAKKYRVYLSTFLAIFSLDAEVPQSLLYTRPSYTRNLLKDTIYYIYLTTVDKDNVESAPSEVFKITPDAGTVISYTSEDKILTVDLRRDVRDKILNDKLTMKIQKIDENKYQLCLATGAKIITDYKFDIPFTMIFQFTPIEGKTPAVYYFNGIEYVYRQPTIDVKNCSVKIKSYDLGIYKILQIPTPQNFTITNITPRKIFTPYVGAEPSLARIKFYYHNPDALVQPAGTIYGIDGTFIAKMQNYSDKNYLEWDGKYDTGEYVPKGIYIYLITYKDIRRTGTIIVAR